MNKFIESAGKNIRWFENSGVMRPADGFWGVAERLVALDIEESIRQEIVEKFASRTMLKNSFAVESRRPDCNFETAVMFLLYGIFAQDEQRFTTGENLLDYLYFRSAMKRSKTHKLPCAWRWSDVALTPDGHWLDDNSWCILLQCALYTEDRIATIFPVFSRILMQIPAILHHMILHVRMRLFLFALMQERKPFSDSGRR